MDHKREIVRLIGRQPVAEFREDRQALQRMKTVGAAFADMQEQIDFRTRQAGAARTGGLHYPANPVFSFCSIWAFSSPSALKVSA